MPGLRSMCACLQPQAHPHLQQHVCSPPLFFLRFQTVAQAMVTNKQVASLTAFAEIDYSNKYPSQRSAPITLAAGQSVLLTASHCNAQSLGYVQVRKQRGQPGLVPSCAFVGWAGGAAAAWAAPLWLRRLTVAFCTPFSCLFASSSPRWESCCQAPRPAGRHSPRSSRSR